jgi:hypothetical protein
MEKKKDEEKRGKKESGLFETNQSRDERHASSAQGSRTT